ncbi:MAG: CpsD/CapB family tyrosine-protein kinase [Bacillota bacterium]
MPKTKPDLHLKLITKMYPRAPVVEAYRVLRTNLQFVSLDNPVKTIAVTSATPMEGKTLTSVNLAIAMALSGDRVILVDSDLRRPSVHKALEMENAFGLTNVLAGGVPLDEVLRDAAAEGLKVITCGPIPPNPAELLGSARMRDFLQDLKSKADKVILDGPPVLGTADASLLASISDGVLLVCRAGQVSYTLAQKSKEILQNAHSRILGVVLGGIHVSGRDEYYYYCYYYDSRGPEDGR